MSRTLGSLQAWSVVLLILTVCLGAGSARAQTAQETALARTMFEEGVKLGDQGQWGDAADRFRRAYTLKPTPGIAFNLASALAETGKVVEASELLEKIARDPAASSELKAEAEAKLGSVAPRKAYLTVRVLGADGQSPPPADTAHVEVDGVNLPPIVWGIASPVDPGAHALSATSPPNLSAEEQVSLSDGERREVTLVLKAPAPVVAPAPGPVAPEVAPEPVSQPVQPRSERKPLYKRWVLWTGIGAVVVAGAVVGILATSGGSGKAPAPVPGNTGVLTW